MQLSPRTMARVALFTALCVAAAVFFRFGGSVVPFSLVPFVVFLSGFLLPPREAFLSMALYVLLGLLGLPVFATPPFGGLAYVFRPTFGFLLGFMLAAPRVEDKDASTFSHHGLFIPFVSRKMIQNKFVALFEECNMCHFFLSTGEKTFPIASAKFFHLYQKN